MDGKERREKIISTLKGRKEALSGSALAQRLGVSRQVIVQDIALLRTEYPILATAQGYLLHEETAQKARRAYLVSHNREAMREELNLIVDNGGTVLNVIVEHDVYGQLVADMNLSNRREVMQFCRRLEQSTSGPLLTLTDGAHIHTVEAESEEILDEIEENLKQKNFLLS